MDREEILQKALAHLNRAEYSEAWHLFLQLKEMPLNNINIAFQLVDCFVALDKQQELNTVMNFLKQHAANDPRFPIALAKITFIKKQYRQTIQHLKSALALSPNNATVYYNMGCLLQEIGKFRCAKQFFLRSLELAPDQTASHINLGLLGKYLGEYHDSKSHYEKVIKREPNNINAHVNLGMHYLAEENYKQGWPAYEWRLVDKGLKDIQRRYDKPRWQGEFLQDKRLIIFSEQGFGDAIQFVRYIPLIDKSGGEVYLECKRELIRLLKSMPAIDGFVKKLGDLPAYDYYLPLLSLPYLFETDLNSIPAQVPYLSVAQEDKQKWHDFFSSYGNQLKIGIAWEGSKTHVGDKFRSIDPSLFKQLLQFSQVTLFSLQKEADEAFCKQHGFISLGQYFNDFMDTAACIDNLDLVISVDTSVLHLTGALNKPAWGLIGFISDWRWGREKTTSAWYPSMKLFRQKKLGDWDSVFDEVSTALKEAIDRINDR